MNVNFHSPRQKDLLKCIWVACAVFLAAVLLGGSSGVANAAATSAEGYRIGLNFVEAPHLGPIGLAALDEEGQVDSTFYPVQITHAFSSGALEGWTEAATRRAIVLAIEDAYRAVDTGDPTSTLAVQFYEGALSSDAPGRQLNVIFGRNQSMSSGTLGLALFTGAAFSSTSLPNGSDAVAIYVDHLNQLVGVQFTQAAHVINNLAGTAAHEIGHLFDLEHVPADTQEPYAIMSTGSTGLSLVGRLTIRRFETTAGTQAGGHSSASLLLTGIGTVAMTDFNMDGTTDLNGDANILLQNIGRSNALFQEGDSNADHIVDVSADASRLLAALDVDVPALCSASARLNPATGQILVSAHDIRFIELRSKSGALLFDNFQAPGEALSGADSLVTAISDAGTVNLVNYMDLTVSLGPGGILDNFSIGALLPIGFNDIEDLLLRYQTLGQNSNFVQVTLIPEPSRFVFILSAAIGTVPLFRRRMARA